MEEDSYYDLGIGECSTDLTFTVQDCTVRCDNMDSYAVFNIGCVESQDFEVFYKGEKLINVASITISPGTMIFEEKKSWKEKIESGKYD